MSRGTLRPRLVLGALLLGGLANSVRAAGPVLEFLYPAGGRAGTEVQVEAAGKNRDWPVMAWSYPAGLEVEALETPGRLRVTLAEDAAPGPRWIRLFNSEGASDPRLFMVGHLPSVLEQEPNDEPAEAQAMGSLPCTVEGRLKEREDVDAYRITLEAGQWLVAELQAYRLDSPMDAILQVTDLDNIMQELNHDGPTLDPRLVWRAEKAGDYLVKVAAFAYPPQANVRFTSGEDTVYRLDLYVGPYAAYAWPPGVGSEGKTSVEVFGWNLDLDAKKRRVEVEGTGGSVVEGQVLVRDERFENLLSLPVGPHPARVESEPNDDASEAPKIELPCTIHGRLTERLDVDRHAFDAVKDHLYSFRIDSASLGYAGDMIVMVEDRDGKMLDRDDDGPGGLDPHLHWKAPADGSYLVAVMDLFARGSSNRVYRLHCAEEMPGVTARTRAHTLAVQAGEEATLEVEVERRGGFKGEVVIEVEGLPEGVTTEPVTVPVKADKATVTLKADAEAPATHASLRVRVVASKEDNPVSSHAIVLVKGRHAEEGDLMRNSVPAVWLTVREK